MVTRPVTLAAFTPKGKRTIKRATRTQPESGLGTWFWDSPFQGNSIVRMARLKLNIDFGRERIAVGAWRDPRGGCRVDKVHHIVVGLDLHDGCRVDPIAQSYSVA